MIKRRIYCVVVGNEVCDKETMLNSCTLCLAGNIFFLDGTININVDGQPIELNLHDTSGNEHEPDRLHSRYSYTDIFVIVFSLVGPSTLEEVERKWVPDIKEHRPGVPYILVGVHVNERNNFSQHAEEYNSKGLKPISTS